MKVIFVKEGHWVDYATQLQPSTPIPWLHISEPTGFIGWVFNFTFKPSGSPIPKMRFSSLLSAENCSGFSHPSLRKTAYDLDCRQKHSTVCQVSQSLWIAENIQKMGKIFVQDTVSQFWLRGLCPSSTLDTVYKLRQDLSQVNSSVIGFSNSPNAWNAFFALQNINWNLNIVFAKGLRQFGGPSGWLLHWTGWALLSN